MAAFRQCPRNPSILTSLPRSGVTHGVVAEVGKPSGLARRGGSASYYFRQRCPKRLKRPGVPAEIWISLGTASYAEALTRVDDARAEAGRRFNAEPPVPTGLIHRRSPVPIWPSDP